eukprot:GGOE01042789.1.p2 GENE.GGOE01042789.1~~GGOE01042789.1.p2  ORF type:complete len:173 (-),score=37.15 GGOE01042789.1:838-1356(-)
MPEFSTQASLQCSACSRCLGSPVCIIDDSYFLRGKPAFLLQDLLLDGCPLSAVEKRAMRSGTYDISWIQCGCGVSLGFLYHGVYGDAYAYKLGKAVIAQDALMIRSVVTPVQPPPTLTPAPCPSTAPVAARTPPAVLAKPTESPLPPATPPADGDEFVLVEDDTGEDVIALD